MNKPNRLPAVVSTTGEQSLQPCTIEYLIAEEEDAVSIAPLNNEQLALLNRQTTTGKMESVAAGSGVIINLAGSLSHLPYDVGIGVSMAGLAIALGASIGRPIQLGRVKARQEKQRQASLSGPDAVVLPNRWIGTDIPEELLDGNVEYPAGGSIARVSARAMLASVGSAAPGLRQHADARNGQMYWQVSPGQLITQGLDFLDDEYHDPFLHTAYPALTAMHTAVPQLPAQGLMPRTPGSLREGYMQPAQDLLFGALGAYAMLRETAGPAVARRVRSHYAGGNEELLKDIVRLDDPTRYGIPWAAIEDFRDSIYDTSPPTD